MIRRRTGKVHYALAFGGRWGEAKTRAACRNAREGVISTQPAEITCIACRKIVLRLTENPSTAWLGPKT